MTSVPEKLRQIFVQLPVCSESCDLDDTYLNKLLDYLDCHDLDPVESGLLQFVEVLEGMPEAPLDLVSFSISLMAIQPVIQRREICVKMAECLAVCLKRFSVSSTPALECSTYRTGLKLLAIPSLFNDVCGCLDIPSMAAESLLKPDGSIFALRSAFDFELAFLRSQTQISALTTQLTRLLDIGRGPENCSVPLNLLTDFWSAEDSCWLELNEKFTEIVQQLLVPPAFHCRSSELQMSILRAYGLLVVRNKCETEPAYMAVFQQLSDVAQLRLAEIILLLRQRRPEYSLEGLGLAQFCLRTLLAPLNCLGGSADQLLNVSLSAFCDRLPVSSTEELLSVAESLNSFSSSYAECQLKVRSHFWRAAATVFKKLGDAGRNDSCMIALQCASQTLLGSDISLREKLMAGSFVTSVLPSVSNVAENHMIEEAESLQRSPDWELRDLSVQMIKLILTRPIRDDSVRLCDLLIQQLSDASGYVVASSVAALEELMRGQLITDFTERMETTLTAIMNVLNIEFDEVEPRRAVVKFCRSAIECGRIPAEQLDEFIRSCVQTVVKDHDWEVKEDLVKLLDSWYFSSETVRKSPSAVVACLLELIDDADVSVAVVRLGQKIQSELLSRPDFTSLTKEFLTAGGYNDQTAEDMMKLIQLTTTKTQEFLAGELVAHVNDADTILDDIHSALHRNRLELDCY